MNNRFQKRPSLLLLFACLSGMLFLLFGLAFSLSAQPALAQTGYPVETATEPGYPVVTNTPSATTGAATATRTATATTSAGTLPPPSATGTPTVLFPVTGADLTQQGGGPGTAGVWIALWLLGLLLIGYGLRSKLWKH